MDAPGSEGVGGFSKGPEGEGGTSELHLKLKLNLKLASLSDSQLNKQTYFAEERFFDKHWLLRMDGAAIRTYAPWLLEAIPFRNLLCCVHLTHEKFEAVES